MPADPVIGEIYIGAFNFAPNGHALCQGQLLNISSNTALFSLLGTNYGGDGRATFGLPDLRGRFPMGEGQGPGLSDYDLGQNGGTETVTLLTSEIPAHNHTLSAMNIAGDVSNPSGALLANSGALDKEYKGAPVGTPVLMHSSAIGTAGGSQPHNNLPPYLVLNFYIATQGIFPPRP